MTKLAEKQQTSTALWIDPQYGELFARNGLHTLDDLFALEHGVKLEKACLPPWRERLAVDLSDSTGETRRFYVKRYRRTPATRRRLLITGGARRSAAGVERFWIELLRADGIEVPRIAAFGEDCGGRREQRSALVLVEVPGLSLEKWAQRYAARAPASMIEALARFVGHFHALGYVHRDLYLSHVFWHGHSPQEPQFTLIDLQRVMRRPLRHRRWLLRDLAQLHYSVPEEVAGPRERLRFLRAYLGVRTLHGRGARLLINGIMRKSAGFAAREARRARRSSGKGGAGP